MPHIPDSNHDSHDLELVAAFAAGDAAGTDLEAATALVAACAACATLDADLRSIAAALVATPAPVRTRDFRLSPDQAAALRPSGWRRLVAAFASPRLSFTTPLGTGLAAFGIVGVLVATGGISTGGATSGAATGSAGGYDTTMTLESAAPAASADPREEALTGPAAASPSPAAVPAPAKGAAASEAPAASSAQQAAIPDEPTADPAIGGAENFAQASPVATVNAAVDADAPLATGRAADQTLLIVAGVALLTGLALLALRWTSRRVV